MLCVSQNTLSKISGEKILRLVRRVFEILQCWQRDTGELLSVCSGKFHLQRLLRELHPCQECQQDYLSEHKTLLVNLETFQLVRDEISERTFVTLQK